MQLLFATRMAVNSNIRQEMLAGLSGFAAAPLLSEGESYG